MDAVFVVVVVVFCGTDAIRPVDPPGMLSEAYLLSDPLPILGRLNSKSQRRGSLAMHARRSLAHALLLFLFSFSFVLACRVFVVVVFSSSCARAIRCAHAHRVFCARTPRRELVCIFIQYNELA